MTVGITDTMISEDKFNYYVRWLENSGVVLKWIKLSYKLDNIDEIDFCDRIILTGGQDIDPVLYNGPINHPKIISVDRRRDDFEKKIIDIVIKKKIPTIAICRGMQLVNVHLCGSLIPDVEDAGFNSHKSEKGKDNLHNITVKVGSNLYDIVGIQNGMVNSSHHQAVDRLGEGLVEVAHSEDGIIEAVEPVNHLKSTFIMLVQWHPERISDSKNPFTTKILQKFLAMNSNQFSN